MQTGEIRSKELISPVFDGSLLRFLLIFIEGISFKVRSHVLHVVLDFSDQLNDEQRHIPLL